MQFNPLHNIKTDKTLIFEFDKDIPEWLKKSSTEQFYNFGFEYGHHGVSPEDNKPYFGKLLYLKEENIDRPKPHCVLSIVDMLRYKILPDLDKKGEFLEIQRIAVNGQLNNQKAEKHIDTSDYKDLWTCVYYVTDSDGDTVFYRSLKNKDEEIFRSKYKQGKLILFPGTFLHQAIAPTNSWRVTIGISFHWKTNLNNQLGYDI